MTLQNKVLRIDSKAGFFGVLFCVLLSVNVLAQSDEDKDASEPDVVLHTYDGIENPDITQMEHMARYKAKQKELKKELETDKNIIPPKKENEKKVSEKDLKREKEDMSTLSFNLFLYIVDRFKEDK